MLGTASLTPTDPVEVRTFRSFVLTYTVGTLGIDDTGGIRIAWRTAGNSRTALLYAIRSRHHYATTGCRLNLDVTSNGLAGASMMGDIVPT
ncbi:MAG: hypothetical protein VXX00_03085, partial [Pseudomonadota bacterium]|nr:hypothetical protein [Pseudomonadota bacterium]